MKRVIYQNEALHTPTLHWQTGVQGEGAVPPKCGHAKLNISMVNSYFREQQRGKLKFEI